MTRQSGVTILCKSVFHREKLPKHRLGEMSDKHAHVLFLSHGTQKVCRAFFQETGGWDRLPAGPEGHQGNWLGEDFDCANDSLWVW